MADLKRQLSAMRTYSSPANGMPFSDEGLEHLEGMCIAAASAGDSTLLEMAGLAIRRLRRLRQRPGVTSLQNLWDAGINPFAVVLVAESLLKHPNPQPVRFAIPINRQDCDGWAGVEFELNPVKRAVTEEMNLASEGETS